DGRWRISLWLDDPGEWDAIPHPLARVVRLNGHVVTDRRSDPAGWIAARYLAGRAAEAVLDGDAWALHGRGRGGRVDATLEVRGGRGLTVELDGDGFRATHLAALLAAPQDGTAALAAVERGRAERFAATWSETAPAWPPATGLALQRIPFRQFLRTDTAPLDPDAPLLAAPGSALTVDLLASAAWPDREARLEVTPPEHAGVTLPVALRHGHWRLRRDRDASTLLVADARHLVAGGDPLRLDPRLPRRLVLRVEVPAATPPGHYRGALTLRSRGVATTQPLLLEVLPLQLPGPGLPLGVYLGEAPHLTWFDPLAAARAAQRQCDLDLLRGLGLTALAPPLPLPDARGRDAYQQRLRQLAASGFGLPLLDYATVKQLRYRDGAEATAASLAGAVAAAAAAGLPEPLWAVADEPPTDAEYAAWLQALTATLRAGGPGIRLAGQLNHRRHAALLPLLDVALVNGGFGADADDLAAVRRAGAEPWLYNLPDHRLAAGFHAWRVGAAGYLQWHARMPSADPFDPTDGREDDFQFLYPEATACSPLPDLDAGLLALAEGITDLRWLRWLQQAAPREPRAAALLAELRATLPGRWSDAARLDPDRLRSRITALARDLLSIPQGN
ncbi:MAG TPA: hypothetical protein VIX81_01695, partial [Gammaproteobacteria bacterium]